MTMKRIMIVGAGQMGSGIAQVFAQSNFDVILHDENEDALKKGMENIEKWLSRSLTKKQITKEEKTAIIKRVQLSTQIKEAKSSDIIIEAVTENITIKSEVLKELDRVAPKHAILATNTSSLSITELAAVTKRPNQVIGMHFMNPVPLMDLVEVIRGLQTSDETFQAITKITKQIKKTPVEAKDFPGFIANRILMPMINEAIYAVYEGVASPEDIDTVMKRGMNHPMGPLTLADFIGLDTCVAIMEVLYEGFADSKYRPCPLLRQYVNAGWLGKKAGRGFFVYDQ